MAIKKTESKSAATKNNPSKEKKFSIKEAIKFGYKIAVSNKMYFLKVSLATGIVYILAFILSLILSQDYLVSNILGQIISFVVGGVFTLGLINISLALVDGEKPKVKDVFYLKPIPVVYYIIGSLVSTVIIVIGFICLIIPGIILSIKLSYVSYFLVDKKMNLGEAIRGSWTITKGVKMQLFLFGLALALFFFGLFAVLLLPMFIITAVIVSAKLAGQYLALAVVLGVITFIVGLVGSVILSPIAWIAPAYVYRKLQQKAS